MLLDLNIYSNFSVFFNFFFLLVRGMMYYWQALILQYFIESAGDNGYFSIYILCSSSKICHKPFIYKWSNELYIISLAALSEGYRTMDSYEKNKKLLEEAQAMADLKFTYVVSCQVYGSQKKSKNTRDRSCYTNILSLMLTWVNTTICWTL